MNYDTRNRSAIFISKFIYTYDVYYLKSLRVLINIIFANIISKLSNFEALRLFSDKKNMQKFILFATFIMGMLESLLRNLI
jgi:hypothetical protein